MSSVEFLEFSRYFDFGFIASKTGNVQFVHQYFFDFGFYAQKAAQIYQ